MAKIEVGGKVFTSKSKLTNYCKYVLNSGVDLLEGDYLEVLKGVLELHEDYDSKVGKGDFKIGIRSCPVNPRNKQFYILRADGTDTDFSYVKCINKPSKDTQMKKALRNLVIDQVREYKDEYFKKNKDSKGYVICPVTKLKINKKSSHLDHYELQFNEIVKLWLEKENIDIKNITLVKSEVIDYDMIIEEEEIKESFYKFHKEHASYRVVLDKVNLQRSPSKNYKIF